MKYILDFDRTLFDTDGLYEELSKIHLSHASGKMVSLDSLNLKKLVFPDALEFLASHNRADMFIVSSYVGTTASWNPDYQAEKIKRSGVSDFVSQVEITDEDKILSIRALVNEEKFVFVDDQIKNLRSVTDVFSEAICFLMKRQKSSLQSSSEFLSVSSFSQLDVIIGKS